MPNSNARAADLNTNFSSHLPFAKVSVNYPPETMEADDVKMSPPTLKASQLDSCKLVKSKSQRVKSSDLDEFDEEDDATVTTECSDGPGCHVPWLKPANKDKLEAALPHKISPTKSVRSKRIAKAEKSAISAIGPKRAYKKKADRI